MYEVRRGSILFNIWYIGRIQNYSRKISIVTDNRLALQLRGCGGQYHHKKYFQGWGTGANYIIKEPLLFLSPKPGTHPSAP
jgi:hypothetical protein